MVLGPSTSIGASSISDSVFPRKGSSATGNGDAHPGSAGSKISPMKATGLPCFKQQAKRAVSVFQISFACSITAFCFVLQRSRMQGGCGFHPEGIFSLPVAHHRLELLWHGFPKRIHDFMGHAYDKCAVLPLQQFVRHCHIARAGPSSLIGQRFALIDIPPLETAFAVCKRFRRIKRLPSKPGRRGVRHGPWQLFEIRYVVLAFWSKWEYTKYHQSPILNISGIPGKPYTRAI